MKISFPLDNGTFQFDGKFEEFEKLFNTPLTIDDIDDIDDIDEALDNIREAIDGKCYPDPSELFAEYAAKEGKKL